MDTKKLRQKILDLAIRGKLVPQDPNDEPASVLLERIRAEKERLIAEGKIKRPKKSKASSAESHYQNFVPPFPIPDSWEWVRLEDIIRVKSGESLNVRELQSKDRFPIYGGNGINGYYDKYNVEKDTIIIGRVGFYCGSIHKTKSESWVTDNALIVDSYPTNIDTDWLCLTLIWSNLRKTSNSTAQPVVSGKSIYPIYVPLPPESEQHRIVNTFDVFINAIGIIELGKNSIQDLILLTKSKILDLAMQGKLVPQDPADEPAADMLLRINPKATIITDNPHYKVLPKLWISCTLESVVNIKSAKRVMKDDWKNNGIPFYRTREIIKLSHDGYVDNQLYISQELYDSYKDKYGVPKTGDIMLTAVGTIGETYIVKKSDLFYYKDASVLCVQPVNNLLDSAYFCLFIRSNFAQKQIHNQSKGTTVDTITIEKANNYTFIFPPLKEQKRLVAEVKKLYSILDEIKASLQS